MTTRLWGPTRLVNENTDLDQGSPQVAVMPDGLIVVVWDDLDEGVVKLRLYLPDGTSFGPEIALTGALPGVGRPAITAVSCGCDVLISYQGENDELIVLAVDPFGGVFPYASAVGTYAAIAADIDGAALIATITAAGDLVVQLDDSFGAFTNLVTVATADLSPRSVDLTYLRDGSAVVVWMETVTQINTRQSLAAPGQTDSIRYQRIDADGNLVGTAEGVSSFNFGEGDFGSGVKVAALEDGGFVIVYSMDEVDDSNTGLDVIAYIIDDTGADEAKQVNTVLSGDQQHADVVGLRDGGFFVVWWSEVGGGTIKGQAYRGTGNTDATPVGQEIRIGAAPGGLQDERGLAVALTPDGRIVVTWEALGADADGYGVRTQIVDPRDGYVEGTDAEDLLYGSAFEDQVLALDGDDFVYAGSSTDEVRGGGGIDVIFGEAGDDELYGEEAGDLLGGGAGHDLLDGGGDEDALFGDAGDDEIYGGGGSDYAEGGAGADELYGEDGDDFLMGGAGNDFIDGGGDDLFDEDDTVSFQDKTAGVTLALDGDNLSTAFVGGVAEDTIVDVQHIVGGDGNDTFTGDDDNNTIEGGAGDDILDGGAGGSVGRDNLRGGDGNDRLIGDQGDDLTGHDGIDTADYSLVTVSVLGSLIDGEVIIAGDDGEVEEVENLIGGSAGDRLTGDAGDNALSGSGANDLLKGGAGNDLLDGGDGGGDAADYRDKTLAVSVTLTGNSLAEVSVGGVVEDTIRGIEFIFGGKVGDTLNGDGNANLFRGGGGADAIYGGGGADTVDFRDKTAAVVLALDGLNVAIATVGGLAEDTVRSIEGIYGGTAGDTLTGDQYNNRLYGGGGADVLRGGRGADVLAGGFGADMFVYGELLDSRPLVSRFDTILDFSGKDGDRIDLTLIDADTTQATDQAFVVGTMTAGTAGVLEIFDLGGFQYRVDGDVNGDGVSDFRLLVQTSFHVLEATDFLL